MSNLPLSLAERLARELPRALSAAAIVAIVARVKNFANIILNLVFCFLCFLTFYEHALRVAAECRSAARRGKSAPARLAEAPTPQDFCNKRGDSSLFVMNQVSKMRTQWRYDPRKMTERHRVSLGGWLPRKPARPR